MKPVNSLALLLAGLAFIAPPALAQPAEHVNKASQAASQASGNLVGSVGHSLAATGQLASGLFAVPVLASGALAVSTGAVASGVGGALLDSANAPIGQPLPLAQDAVSIVPPNQALQKSIAPNR